MSVMKDHMRYFRTALLSWCATFVVRYFRGALLSDCATFVVRYFRGALFSWCATFGVTGPPDPCFPA